MFIFFCGKKHTIKFTFLTSFEVHSTISLIIVTVLFDRYRTFLFCFTETLTYCTATCITPSLQAWATIILLSASMSLTILNTLYNWNHVAFVLVIGLSHLPYIMCSKFIHVVGCHKISFLSRPNDFILFFLCIQP